MALEARVPGRCAKCNGAITVGEMFVWGQQRGQRIHEHCGNGAKPMPVETPVAAGLAKFTWSPLQEAVFTAVLEGEGNFIIIAVAGSGKSTTIVEAAKRYAVQYPDRTVCMVAFGAKNGKELQEKVAGTTIQAGTFHATCNSILTKHLGRRPAIERTKVNMIARELVRNGQIDRHDAGLYLKGAIKLAQNAKGAGVGIPGLREDCAETWCWLKDRFEVEFDGPEVERGIAIARRLFAESHQRLDMVDFDDMLYLVALWDLPVPEYSIVFVDEAQDFNALQRWLTKKLIGTHGRLIAVGDPYQAIFGFRGADFDSLDRIREEFACKDLVLDVSYRCPQAIVRWAQEVVPHIQAHDQAPEGSVTHLDSWKLRDFKSTDYVLCRLTAPLIQLAYQCVSARVPVKVLGREIGDGLISLINKQEAVDLRDLQDRLDDFRREEVERLIARDEDAKAEALEDKIACIYTIMGGLPTHSRTIDGLTREIESLFSDKENNGTLLLMTCHKAKGLEAPRVFILEPGLMPSARARTDEQQQQELNLMYVARTRAKEEAYTIYLNDIR